MSALVILLINFLIIVLVIFTQLHLYKSENHMSKCLTCSFSLTMAVLLALFNFSLSTADTFFDRTATLYPIIIALFAFYLRWKKGRLTIFIRLIFSTAIISGLIDYLIYVK